MRPTNRFGALPEPPARRGPTGAGLRVLFVGEAVSLAHVARPAVLARWAREAGHEVRFACGARYAGVARAEGLEPIDIETVEAGAFYARLAKGRFFYGFEELQGYVRAELGLIREFRPDLVVGDFRLTLPISARLAGVKCLSLANAHWSPAAERNLPAPESGIFGVVPRLLREKLFGVVRPLAYRFFAAPLDRVRRSHGLPAFDDFRKHYTAGDFCAYLDLPELFHRRDAEAQRSHVGVEGDAPQTSLGVSASQRLTRLPSGHFFLGPVSWAPRSAPEPLLRDLGLERPLAYVSMGSSGDGSQLPEILRALLNSGCDLAVSGVRPAEEAALRRELPGLAGRSYIAEFFDPRTSLASARLAVCHGGSGTVYQALAAGVPVLCCPSNPDQKLVSQALLSAGAGELVDWTNLEAQIAGMLAGECRAGARRLALAMERHDTRSNWQAFLEGGRTMVNRATLTQHLRILEGRAAAEPAASADRFAFGSGGYTIRVANDLESRRKAYGLVYRLYLEKEYARPHPSRMWLSIYDALPETVTLLVERTAVEGGGWKVEGRSNPAASTFHPPPSTAVPAPSPSTLHPPPSTASAPVGALTVVFDSPMGLPADNLYRPELDALRFRGRRLAEIVSLGVAEESGANGSQILIKLFNHAYLAARRVRQATDLVITVNPRHVKFYEKTLLFSAAGPEREYGKVGGAPALLLRLDLGVPEERVRLEHGPGYARPARDRTLYPMFHPPADEPEVVAGLAAALRPMTGAELGYFFVAETSVLRDAAPEQRALIQERCRFYGLEAEPDAALVRK